MATMVSSVCGLSVMRMVMASTSILSQVTSGNSAATAAAISSHITMAWRWAFDLVTTVGREIEAEGNRGPASGVRLDVSQARTLTNVVKRNVWIARQGHGMCDPVQGYRRCEMTLLKALKSDRKNANALLVNILDVEDDKERKSLFGQGRVI